VLGRQGGHGGGDFAVNRIGAPVYFSSADGLWQEQAWPYYSSAFPETRDTHGTPQLTTTYSPVTAGCNRHWTRILREELGKNQRHARSN